MAIAVNAAAVNNQIYPGGAVMKLMIDGIPIIPEPEESLLQLIRRIGLDTQQLSQRPLAAKIAGEVFNLNYIPVRKKDVIEEQMLEAIHHNFLY